MAGVFAGQQRRPRRSAHRAAGVVLSEPHPLAGEAIQVRRREPLLAVDTDVAVTEIIGLDQQDVERTGALHRRRGRGLDEHRGGADEHEERWLNSSQRSAPACFHPRTSVRSANRSQSYGVRLWTPLRTWYPRRPATSGRSSGGIASAAITGSPQSAKTGEAFTCARYSPRGSDQRSP